MNELGWIAEGARKPTKKDKAWLHLVATTVERAAEELQRAEHRLQRLKADSAWLMETWLYEYTDLDQGKEHIVAHSCDFALRPDIGACDWHEKWFEIAERNGMMEVFFQQDADRG